MKKNRQMKWKEVVDGDEDEDEEEEERHGEERGEEGKNKETGKKSDLQSESRETLLIILWALTLEIRDKMDLRP